MRMTLRSGLNKKNHTLRLAIRDFKIDVYGKRLTSDILFAIKTKSLTVLLYCCDHIKSNRSGGDTVTLNLKDIFSRARDIVWMEMILP